MTPFEPIIGLEVHARLLTRSKLFCADPNIADGVPNSLTSPVSLALPGTLPVLNREAVELAIIAGLSCGCSITRYNRFDRKHYFYPDLPKGYQITQVDTPLCRHGALRLIHPDFYGKKIALERIHLEEDSGKSIHDHETGHTLVDLNRAGAPLIELVTAPVMHTPDEAAAFVYSWRTLVRFLGVCDGNMESGSLRCDVNISLRPRGDHSFGTRVELKNINSLSSLRKAIKYEIDRQSDCLLKGRKIMHETRGYDAVHHRTFSQRAKEDAWDYRTIPEPDIPPFDVDECWVESVRKGMPALPYEVFGTMRAQGVDAGLAMTISNDRRLSAFYLAAAPLTKERQVLARWTLDPVASLLKEHSGISPEHMAETVSKVMRAVDEKRISAYIARKKALIDYANTGSAAADIESIIAQYERISESEEDLQALVDQVILLHEKDVRIFVSGKTAILDFLIGEVLRAGKGVYDPVRVKRALLKKLNQWKK